MNNSEHADWQEMTDFCGINKPLWMIVDSEEEIVEEKEMFAGYFYFESRPQVTSPFKSLYNTQFTLVGAV